MEQTNRRTHTYRSDVCFMKREIRALDSCFMRKEYLPSEEKNLRCGIVGVLARSGKVFDELSGWVGS